MPQIRTGEIRGAETTYITKDVDAAIVRIRVHGSLDGPMSFSVLMSSNTRSHVNTSASASEA